MLSRLFVAVLFVLGAAVAVPQVAQAQFRAKAVVNPPGLFNRTVAKSSGGAAAASVGGFNRGAAAAASVGGFNRGAAASAGGFSASAAVGRGAAVASVGGGFNRSAVAFRGNRGVAAVGGFGFPANVAFANSQVLFVDKNKVRFNSFGVSTVQDAFGNVFEVDAFGNARFAGNRLGSSAVVTGFVPSATAIGGFHASGFSHFRGSGVCGF